MKASLLVIRGVDQGARFELDDDEASIGRGIRNRIRILDTEMSRHHAVIRCENGSWIVTDRNSSNGTFVNGLSIRSHVLAPGDQILVGRTALLFIDQTAAPRPVPVDLVAAGAVDEASQIVGKVGLDAGPQLLEQSVIGRPDQAAQTLASLQLLYRISEETVSSTLSIEQLLQRILDITLDAVRADRGCMLVADPRTGQFEPRAVAHRSGMAAASRMAVSRSIMDYVLRKGQGVRTSDARIDSRFASGISIVKEGIREALCVPMPGRYELMGIIYVDTTSPSDQTVSGSVPVNKFSDDDLRLLAAIGRQAALAVEDHRFQDAFVKAERLAAMGQTIAILSHHIKNILQGIKGGSYLVDMGLDKHDEDLIRQGWRIVGRNQDRIYHLVMDMLTFSTERQPKLEAGQINDTVREVYELMTARAAEMKVDLRLQLDEELPTALFDTEGIHRAVLNIVTNALEAVDGQAGAIVELRTSGSDDGSEIRVEIADNGPGIPQEQLASVFNLFESTKGARGTGIGLAVSQKILREHGGEILVESQPGRGALFRLVWPSLDEEARASVRRPTT